MAVEKGCLNLLIEQIQAIGMKNFRIWQPKNQTKYTFSSLDSKKCNLLLQYAELLTSIFAFQDNTILYLWIKKKEML